jgi:DNA-binding MarR family transcriptional regulator
VSKRNLLALANVGIESHYLVFPITKNDKKIMKLFTALREIREFQRQQLPFLKSVIDFDILIEIGYAEEQKQPLTLKQLFLTNVGSLSSVRRRLARLEEQGMVTRRADAGDRRSAFLFLTSSSLKMLGKYGKFLTRISIMG